MKNLMISAFCIALAISPGFTAYAAEAPDRESLEAAIWEDLWNGKGDNGLEYPEASNKHHLLDKWLDDNYGTGGYDWTDVGEVTHGYRRYYRDLIDGWDFEDDNNGNWTITTPEHSYSFTLFQGEWSMLDENGDTVDTFPPFSTLEEDSSESANGYKIQDDGADSPRVIGKVTGDSQMASERLASEESNGTSESLPSESESDSERSGVDPLVIIAGVAALAGIGSVAYYFNKKK